MNYLSLILGVPESNGAIRIAVLRVKSCCADKKVLTI